MISYGCNSTEQALINSALSLGITRNSKDLNLPPGAFDAAAHAAQDCAKHSTDPVFRETAKAVLQSLSYYVRYEPSFSLAIFGIVAFSITFALHLCQTGYDFKKYRRIFSVVVLPGALLELIGWCERLQASRDPLSYSAFVGQLATLTISALFMSAFVYAVFGLMIVATNPSLLPQRFQARRLSWTFIVIDLITLLIQAAGGGIASSNKASTSRTGSHIMLAGIILQLICMIVLAVIYIWFFTKAKFWGTLSFGGIFRGPSAKFNQLFVGIALSIVLIIMRGVYRTAELAGGFDSKIAQTQGFLIGLDMLPMLIVLLIFNLIHPCRTLPGTGFYGPTAVPQQTPMQGIKPPEYFGQQSADSQTREA